MKTFTVHAHNRAHYATFNVTAEDNETAAERVTELLDSEDLSREEYEMQDFSGDAYDVWPQEDFLYGVSLVEESEHSDDLKMIDSGGNG